MVNKLCIFGLLPYILVGGELVYLNYKEAIVPLIVGVNGLVYHGVDDESKETRKHWDIFWNVVLIMYVNMKTKYKLYTVVLTIISLVMYYINQRLRNDYIHVVGVQWVLFIAMCLFIFGEVEIGNES